MYSNAAQSMELRPHVREVFCCSVHADRQRTGTVEWLCIASILEPTRTIFFYFNPLFVTYVQRHSVTFVSIALEACSTSSDVLQFYSQSQGLMMSLVNVAELVNH